MDDLLNSLLGGMSGESDDQDENPMAGLLGGILGAASGAGDSNPASSNLVGDLLEGLMGGGQGGGIADLLGAAFGGGSGSATANPLVNMLAEKIGVSPAIAQMVVSFFLSKMVSGQFGAGGGQRAAGIRTGGPESTFDLDDLLGSLGDSEALNARLGASGLPDELAQTAGIDPDTASRSLQELLGLVAKQRETPKPVTTDDTDLKSLLDNWDTD